VEAIDDKGRTFYHHPRSKQTCWSLPQGAVMDLAATFRRRRHMLQDRLHTAAALTLTEAQSMGQAGR
jgi:hypothetical protein